MATTSASQGDRRMDMGVFPGDTATDGEPAELRIDDLARMAGTTVRNVRAYQDRGLLQAPRRAGRVAWYGPGHLSRLRLIGSLRERGFTLASIRELLDRWAQGQDLGDLLGLGQQLTGPYTDEVPDVGTFEEIAERYQLTTEDFEAIEQSLSFGLVEVDGDLIRVPSPRLLRAGLELHRVGVPYDDLFAELHRLRADVEAIAERFARLVVRTVVEPRLADGMPAPGEAPGLADIMGRLRPLATTVVGSELARALARRSEAELGDRLIQIVAQLASSHGRSAQTVESGRATQADKADTAASEANSPSPTRTGP